MDLHRLRTVMELPGKTDLDVEIETDALVVFKRGDCNADGEVQTLADPLFSLGWAFQDGDDPPCMAAADCNGDGEVQTLADPLYSLAWAFQDGPGPPDPGTEECGSDPSGDDGPGCVTPPECTD